MKRKPRKLVLSRETLTALEDRSLRLVGGGSHFNCSAYCDSYYDCSTACIIPTNIWHACE